MTDRELMQQALEDICGAKLCEINSMSSRHEMIRLLDKAITALRERLAQPEPDWDWRHPKAQSVIGAKARLQIKLRLIEQLVEDPNFETTASDMEYWEPLHDKLQERLAQPEQEPVAWKHKHIEGVAVTHRPSDIDRHPDRWTPLYKGPSPCPTCEALARTVMLDQTSHDTQRKPWVGLTDEEMHECWVSPLTPLGMKHARAIEAKLKEKNT